MAAGRLKDGRWYVQYDVNMPDGSKKQRREYFGRGPTGEMKAKARDQEIKASKNEVTIKGSGITLAELIRAYQQAKFIRTGGMSHTDQLATSYKFERFILPFFRHTKVLQIDDDLLKKYIDHRLDMWADKKKTRKLKATTVRRDISVIKAVINWGVNHKPSLVAFNPIANFKMPKRDDESIPPPTLCELKRMLKNAPAHLKRGILLNIATGARAGFEELLKMSWEYQDLDSNVITIFSAKKNKPAKYRRVPISDQMVALLNKWKQEDLELLQRVTMRREEKEARKSGRKPENLAAELTLDDVTGPIVNYRGKAIKSFKRAWRETLQRAKIKRRLRPYELRHFYATQLAESGGVGIKTVAELLGNTPQTAARYYVHSNAGYKKSAADALPSAFELLGQSEKDETTNP